MASRWLSISTTFQLTMPPGMMPQFTSDNPNVASSAAIAMSQAQTCVNAPPKQKPLTMAMVGRGKVDSLCQRHWLDACAARARSFGFLAPSRK
jgi:hypothetical protein